MTCPECNSVIPKDDLLGRFTCDQCGSRLFNSVNTGIKSINPVIRRSISLGAVVLRNGQITRSHNTPQQSHHPDQPIYTLDGDTVVDCVCCMVPTPYTYTVRGRWWDQDSTIRIEREDVVFGVNRSTDPVSLTVTPITKVNKVPRWVYGRICRECVSRIDIVVKVVKDDLDTLYREQPDTDQVYPKHKDTSRLTVRVKPHKPTYRSRG